MTAVVATGHRPMCTSSDNCVSLGSLVTQVVVASCEHMTRSVHETLLSIERLIVDGPTSLI